MYKDYIFKTKDKPSKSVFKTSLKVIKIVLYSFLLLSMLWGCSEMFISKFNSYQVVDSSGSQVYKSGIFFEIIFYGHGFPSNKLHYGHLSGSTLYEYSYLSIDSWGDAFRETQSPFYGVFVYPTSWLLVSIMNLFGGVDKGYPAILAIFFMSLFVRIITISFTWKTQMNQEKMQLTQLKQQEIKNKYAPYKNDPIMKRKQQLEIMELYKKNKSNPLSMIGTTFLSFPFLFALYITIRSTRILKIAQIGQITLIDRPWAMITSGHFIYLVILAVYLPIQISSIFLPIFLGIKKQNRKTPEQKKALRKQIIIQSVFVVVFLFVAISVATGVAIYWIFSGFLQICQTLLFHYGRTWHSQKGKRLKIKSQKMKSQQKMTLIPQNINFKDKKTNTLDLKKDNINNSNVSEKTKKNETNNNIPIENLPKTNVKKEKNKVSNKNNNKKDNKKNKFTL